MIVMKFSDVNLQGKAAYDAEFVVVIGQKLGSNDGTDYSYSFYIRWVRDDADEEVFYCVLSYSWYFWEEVSWEKAAQAA